ncbi:MAG TPA: N-acetylmuramoyl-L-alanine amidase, partial [Blastocatellia bacterium]|nr:N-acetylmuramoyl-L-alanine amidase [Blastocatellia bacterium]
MRRYCNRKTLVKLILLALFSAVAPRPTVNAPGTAGLIGIGEASGESESTQLSNADPLVRNLFISAGEMNRSLHRRLLETRTPSDYRHVIDAYESVSRVGTDPQLAAKSLALAADLMREMADSAGDYTLYQKAIASYRGVVEKYPDSNYVAYALMNIAQIYEESLQDLSGAASAYKEIEGHFPDSVMAREAHAVLLRFESALNAEAGPDVATTPPPYDAKPGSENTSRLQLNNVRNFTAAEYARIVLDVSGAAAYQTVRGTGDNRVEIRLAAAISPTLYGRRFIIQDHEFLKRITVSGPGAGKAGTTIAFDLGSSAQYTIFQLSSPDRLIIDLRPSGPEGTEPAVASGAKTSASVHQKPAGPTELGLSSRTARDTVDASETSSYRKRVARDWGAGILSLPDVDVSNVTAEAQGPAKDQGGPSVAPSSPADGSAAPKASDGSQVPIKCIVIDPGHGGHDTGTIGENGLMEKDLVLDVGKRLRDFIKKSFPGIDVVMTRDSDRFVALEERTAIANAHHADLFISVHANAAPSHVASGVETYYLSPDRASAEDLKAAQRENATLAPENASAKTAAGSEPNNR